MIPPARGAAAPPPPPPYPAPPPRPPPPPQCSSVYAPTHRAVPHRARARRVGQGDDAPPPEGVGSGDSRRQLLLRPPDHVLERGPAPGRPPAGVLPLAAPPQAGAAGRAARLLGQPRAERLAARLAAPG